MNKILSYKFTKEKVKIIGISDTHIGDPLFEEEKLIPYLEEADYIILNGDIMNTATRNSVSFGYGTSPQEDLDLAVKIFKPYAHKVISIIEGNHEYRVAKEVGMSLTQLFAAQIGCLDKYCGDEGYLFLNIGSKQILYTILHSHGFGGGRSIGAKANKLEGMAQGTEADIYMTSHTHQPLVFSQDHRTPNRKKKILQQITQWFVNSGAFLSFGGYAVKFNFKPSSIITPIIILNGNTKEVEIAMKG